MRFIGILVISICSMAILFSTAQGNENMAPEPSTTSDNQRAAEQGNWEEGANNFLGGDTQITFTSSGGTYTQPGYGGPTGLSPKGVLVIGTTPNRPLAGDTLGNPTVPTPDSLALVQQMVNNARLLQQELNNKQEAYQNGRISHDDYENYLETARVRADAILSEMNKLDNAINNAINEAGGINIDVPSHAGSKAPIPITGYDDQLIPIYGAIEG